MRRWPLFYEKMLLCFTVFLNIMENNYICLMAVKQTTMFDVCFRFNPTYELVISARAYMNKPHHKILDSGTEWIHKVQTSIPRELESRFSQWKRKDAFHWGLEFLIWQCPVSDNPIEFCHWLSERNSGELYESMLFPKRQVVPANLTELRDDCVKVLLTWNSYYFSQVNQALLARLAEDARTKQISLENGTMSTEDLVEQATGGLRVSETLAIDQLILIPQHHYAPWNHLTGGCKIEERNLYFCSYPADVLGTSPGEPDSKLLRLTKALSDVSRLRILHFLNGGRRTFAEIVQFSGLTKGTVSHHLVLLRAAGLVVVHKDFERDSDSYSISGRILDEVTGRLGKFLENQM